MKINIFYILSSIQHLNIMIFIYFSYLQLLFINIIIEKSELKSMKAANKPLIFIYNLIEDAVDTYLTLDQNDK